MPVSRVLIVLFLSGCGAREPKSRVELESEFRQEFGFLPSTNVVELRCKIVLVGDTLSKWFLFRCDAATLQTLTNQNFMAATREDLRRWGEASWSQDYVNEKNPNAPPWWHKPQQPENAPVFFREHHDRVSPGGYVYFWLDAPNSRVYGRSLAVE